MSRTLSLQQQRTRNSPKQDTEEDRRDVGVRGPGGEADDAHGDREDRDAQVPELRDFGVIQHALVVVICGRAQSTQASQREQGVALTLERGVAPLSGSDRSVGLAEAICDAQVSA